MKKITLVIVCIAVVVTAAVIGCNSATSPSSNNEGIAEVKSITSTTEEQIERGRYLVTTMLCHDCHSPKVMTPAGPEIDSSRMLSGHPADMPVPKYNAGDAQSWILFNQNLTAFVGSWGVSFAANLSSDATGIGNWSEHQFLKALREGKSKGLDNNRPLLPPMPWNMIRHATDEDLKAIFTYLKSTPPVNNVVPAPIPPAGAGNK